MQLSLSMSMVLNLVPCGARLFLRPAELLLAFTERLEAMGRQGKKGVQSQVGALPRALFWQSSLPVVSVGKTRPALMPRPWAFLVALLTCHPGITVLTAAGPFLLAEFGS